MGASRPQRGQRVGCTAWVAKHARSSVAVNTCGWHVALAATRLPQCRPARARPSGGLAEEPQPMVDKVKKIWMDGEFVDWDSANVHVLTHSLHYGLAAFEGLRAYKRADGATYAFRLREHIDRLFDSCKMALLTPKFTREQVMGGCTETLRTNDMVDGYLRPLVFVGDGAMGIFAPQNPIHTAVIAWKWGTYLGEDALKNGIRAKISSFARLHVNVNLAKAKISGQYTNSVIAKREAKF